VRENISAFGGDPENVTIAGQSAGSFSVNAQIASPLSNGYFDKAICQSGGLLGGRLLQDLETAEKQGMTFMELAMVNSVEELRKIPADKLQELSNDPKSPRFGVVLDDYFLPKDLMSHFKEGKQNQMSVLMGWVTGDGSLFPSDGITSESFKKSALENYGFRADDYLKLFPADTDEQAKLSQQKLNLLSFAGTPAYLMAKFMEPQVWIYEFAHVPTDKPNFPNYGAFHTSEVPFALHTLDQWNRDWKPEELELENQMSDYWVNFAKTGNPNGVELPEWNSYNLDSGDILVIDSDKLKCKKNT